MPDSSPLRDYLAHHPAFRDPCSSTSPLPSLYSDLSRQRRSNPAGYSASIEWWKNILTQVTWDGVQSSNLAASASKDANTALKHSSAQPRPPTTHHDRLVLHLNETAKAAWTIDDVGRPLGLGTVAAELHKTADVVALQTFLRSNAPVQRPAHATGLRAYLPSAGAVASTLLVKPFSWAFSQLGLTASAGGDDDDGSEDEKLWRMHRGDWVIWANLEKVTDAFMRDHYASASLSPLDSLFTTARFRDKLAALKLDAGPAGVPFQLSATDVEVVAKHLVRDRKVAVMDKGVIKLSPHEHEPPSPISEQDRGLLQIAETNAKLETQIAEIERQIDERSVKAKAALRANQKNQVMSYLRSRKMLEELLTKRMGSLETISGVLIKVEQAAGDIELMQAYTTSTSTLRSLLSHPSLQHAQVEDTMSALSDTLANHSEIDQAIQLGNESARTAAGIEEVDDKELEAEMEMLALEKEREEKEEEERRKREEEEAKKRKEEEEKRKETEERKKEEAEERKRERKRCEETRKEQQREQQQQKKDKRESGAEAVSSSSTHTEQQQQAQQAIMED